MGLRADLFNVLDGNLIGFDGSIQFARVAARDLLIMDDSRFNIIAHCASHLGCLLRYETSTHGHLSQSADRYSA
jgi:hypothetical protein